MAEEETLGWTQGFNLPVGFHVFDDTEEEKKFGELVGDKISMCFFMRHFHWGSIHGEKTGQMGKVI